MKKLLSILVLCWTTVGLTGCEDVFTGGSGDKEVKFVNKSTYTVSVSPVGIQDWSGFALAPTESKKVKNVDTAYFTYEPKFRVEVADSSDGRVLFINTDEDTESVEGVAD